MDVLVPLAAITESSPDPHILLAFDEAWADIAGNFANDPQTVETARLRLARHMTSLPQAHIRDVEQVKSRSLELMALLYRARTNAADAH